jgi:hypothetical protein
MNGMPTNAPPPPPLPPNFFFFDRTRHTMDVDAAPPSPGGTPVDTHGEDKRR